MARHVIPDANKINNLCEERGWGAVELAHAAKISIGTAAKIMRGEGRPFRDSLTRIAKALGLSSYVDLLPRKTGLPQTHLANGQRDVNDYIQAEISIGGNCINLTNADIITAIIEEVRKRIGSKYSILLRHAAPSIIKIGIKFHVRLSASSVCLESTLQHDPNKLLHLIKSHLTFDEAVMSYHMWMDGILLHEIATRLDKTEEQIQSSWKKIMTV